MKITRSNAGRSARIGEIDLGSSLSPEHLRPLLRAPGQDAVLRFPTPEQDSLAGKTLAREGMPEHAIASPSGEHTT